MNATMFTTMQDRFARFLIRLRDQPFHPKSGVFNIDELVATIESEVDGTENVDDMIVRHIPRDNRVLRDVMEATNHALTDCPSPLLFGAPFSADPTSSDLVRVARYELIGALMVKAGFTTRLLDDNRRFERWRFAPTSNFFRTRHVAQANEQFISCFAHRLVCFYGVITDVRVPGKELRDNFARANNGMTTEHVLQRELGMAAFNAWTV